jgi:hypothetical protein
MQFLISKVKEEMTIRYLKGFSLELLQSNSFKEGFISGFNEAVHNAPELVITVKELNEYIFKAHGLASHEKVA